MKRHILTILSVVVVAGAAGAALVPPARATNDATQSPVPKVSLEVAIAHAQDHTRGKAVRAEYEKQKDGRWIYDVEVRTASDVMDVKVDADTGKVLAAVVDKEDSDDEDDAD